MLRTYGTRPEHFDSSYPFAKRNSYRVGFKIGGWTERLADGVALLTRAQLTLAASWSICFCRSLKAGESLAA